MRRGWTKFLLFISITLTPLLASLSAFTQANQASQRVNELSLAGLQPGHDALPAAFKRFNAKYAAAGNSQNEKLWQDACTGRSLSVETDSRSLIQTVMVTSLLPLERKCGEKGTVKLPAEAWITGRGLRIGDPLDRVIQLYGEPNSTGPSVHGERELESLYYAFDWAGGGVPQRMQVQCARETGRVVEMILAFPKL